MSVIPAKQSFRSDHARGDSTTPARQTVDWDEVVAEYRGEGVIIMQLKDVRPEPFTKEIHCDRCGRVALLGDAEFEEMVSIESRAGYGSVFGDGNDVQVDLCQHCLKLVLGQWLRVSEPGDRQVQLDKMLSRFDPERHGGEFPGAADSGPQAETAPERHWNCRVIETALPDGGSWYAVHEVHYENGRPIMYTELPTTVDWSSEDGADAGLRRLEKFQEALRKPALKLSDFEN